MDDFESTGLQVESIAPRWSHQVMPHDTMLLPDRTTSSFLCDYLWNNPSCAVSGEECRPCNLSWGFKLEEQGLGVAILQSENLAVAANMEHCALRQWCKRNRMEREYVKEKLREDHWWGPSNSQNVRCRKMYLIHVVVGLPLYLHPLPSYSKINAIQPQARSSLNFSIIYFGYSFFFFSFLCRDQ